MLYNWNKIRTKKGNGICNVEVNKSNFRSMLKLESAFQSVKECVGTEKMAIVSMLSSFRNFAG